MASPKGQSALGSIFAAVWFGGLGVTAAQAGAPDLMVAVFATITVGMGVSAAWHVD